jgi:hypothetical protein
MEVKLGYRKRWDSISIGASIVCAIHCVLLPIFLSTLPFLGIEIMRNMRLEIITIATSLTVGSWALFNGYRKHHHDLWPVIIFILGICCMLIANVLIKTERAEILLKLVGAGSIVTAHGFNLKYCRQCVVCNHEINHENEIQ